MNWGQGDIPALETFLIILFYYTISFYVFGLAKLFPETFQYPFLSGIALLSIVYWTGFLAVGLWLRCSVWVGSWQTCEHGVRGGKLRRRCPRCLALKAVQEELEEAEREAAELARAEQLRRMELATRAEGTANREIARLRETYVPTLAQLRNLSPNEFEDITAGMLDRLEFDVAQTPYVSDHGRDAICIAAGQRYCWNATATVRRQISIGHSFKYSAPRWYPMRRQLDSR